MDPRTLLCVFKALIRGSIEYGSFMFPLHNAGLTDLLERAQRRALRHYIGLRQSTPTNIVYAETGVSPIKHHLLFLASKFIIKYFALINNPLIKKLHDLHTALSNSNRLNLTDKFSLYIRHSA